MTAVDALIALAVVLVVVLCRGLVRLWWDR